MPSAPVQIDPQFFAAAEAEIRNRARGGRCRSATERLVAELSKLLGKNLEDFKRRSSGEYRTAMKTALVEAGALECADAYNDELYAALVALKNGLARGWTCNHARGRAECAALAKHLSNIN